MLAAESVICCLQQDCGYVSCLDFYFAYPWTHLKGWEPLDVITVIKSMYFKELGAFISGHCSQNWYYALSRLDKIEFRCLKKKGNMNFGRRTATDKSFSFLPSKGTRLSFSLEDEFISTMPTIVCRGETFSTHCTPTSSTEKMLLCSVYQQHVVNLRNSKLKSKNWCKVVCTVSKTDRTAC